MGLRAGSTRARKAVVLVVAVATFGVVAVNGAPAAGASTEKIQRAQLRDLLSSVPQSYRASCASWETPENAPAIGPLRAHIVAEVQCHPGDGADVVFYHRFDDADSMNAAFDAYAVAPGDGENCPGVGTWDQDDVDAGRWACYVADNPYGVANAATVIWTHDDSNTFSAAYRHDDDLTTLDDWWSSDDAGPLAEPDSSGLPKTLTTTQWLANGKALKASIPADHRKSCTPTPLTQDGLGDSLYNHRMWLLGALDCRSAGLDSVHYVRFAPGAADVTPLQALYQDYVDNEVDEGDVRDQVGSLTCEGDGDWSRKKATVGHYVCYYGADDKGDFVGMVWTDDDQDIGGFATVSGTDATPLLTFWRDDAGPLGASS